MGSRTYSDEELDEVVAKRLSEKKQTVLEVLEALRPELEGMRREIAGANHIKRTIGRQITRLTESVDESNRQLQAHIALAGHAGDNAKLHRLETEVEGLLELRDEFGIAGMTKAQRAAAPAMAKAFVEGERSVIFWEELGRRIRPVKALAWTFLVGLATTAAYLFAHFALHLKVSGVPI